MARGTIFVVILPRKYKYYYENQNVKYHISAFVFRTAPPTTLQQYQHAGDVERETETSPVDKSHNNAVRPRGC